MPYLIRALLLLVMLISTLLCLVCLPLVLLVSFPVFCVCFVLGLPLDPQEFVIKGAFWPVWIGHRIADRLEEIPGLRPF